MGRKVHLVVDRLKHPYVDLQSFKTLDCCWAGHGLIVAGFMGHPELCLGRERQARFFGHSIFVACLDFTEFQILDLAAPLGDLVG